MLELKRKTKAELEELRDIYQKSVAETLTSVKALEKALELDRRRLGYFESCLAEIEGEMK